ncbi:hypothetical protein AYI70_g1805 [Smittium culicis]|uniref:Uncharacterized protein n=1 Tax=Smittium culicis TaxID=133412 RepID=A0A1R1YB43_9FUNG|nr:hypothetical protein AYI70_g1805 [Smittium culicis]
MAETRLPLVALLPAAPSVAESFVRCIVTGLMALGCALTAASSSAAFGDIFVCALCDRLQTPLSLFSRRCPYRVHS